MTTTIVTFADQDYRIREFFIDRFGRMPEDDPFYFMQWRVRIVEGSAYQHADSVTRLFLEKYDLN